jgi:hypothetical protein
MEKVKVRLETKEHIRYYNFEMPKDFNYETLFLEIIKKAKEQNELKDLYIIDYNSKEYADLLEYLEINNKDFNGIDTLIEEYDYYYLDLSDHDQQGIYLIDLDKIKVFDN